MGCLNYLWSKWIANSICTHTARGNWDYCQVSLDIRIPRVRLQTIGLTPLGYSKAIRTTLSHVWNEPDILGVTDSLQMMEIKKRGLGCLKCARIHPHYLLHPFIFIYLLWSTLTIQSGNTTCNDSVWYNGAAGSFASLQFLGPWFEPDLRLLPVHSFTYSTCGVASYLPIIRS